MHDFELEPEVRDWLDSLSGSDFKRADEVCGMLAEKGTELGGPRPTKGRCDDRLPHPLARPESEADDPERIAIREALAFGKALYDRRAPSA